MSLSRTKSDLIGTFASPATITHGASTSGTLDLTATAGTFESEIGGAVINGTVLSAVTTVVFSYSLDGTNYIQDGGAISVPVTASTTFYVGPYLPPMSAKAAKVTVNNNDTGSVSITSWFQGNVLASSNL